MNVDAYLEKPQPTFVIPPTPEPVLLPGGDLQRGRGKAAAKKVLQYLIEASEDDPRAYALPDVKPLRRQRIALTTSAFEIISPHLDASTRDKVRRLLEAARND